MARISLTMYLRFVINVILLTSHVANYLTFVNVIVLIYSLKHVFKIVVYIVEFVVRNKNEE